MPKRFRSGWGKWRFHTECVISSTKHCSQINHELFIHNPDSKAARAALKDRRVILRTRRKLRSTWTWTPDSSPRTLMYSVTLVLHRRNTNTELLLKHKQELMTRQVLCSAVTLFYYNWVPTMLNSVGIAIKSNWRTSSAGRSHTVLHAFGSHTSTRVAALLECRWMGEDLFINKKKQGFFETTIHSIIRKRTHRVDG